MKNPSLFCLFVLLLFLFCNARFVLFCIVSFFSYARLKMLIETAQIARIITDRIGLHSVLLPLLVIVIVSIGLQTDRDESCEPVRYARFDFDEHLTSKQWRCYRPSGLTRDKARYNGESGVYNTVHGAMLQIREGMRIEVRFSIRMGKKLLDKKNSSQSRIDSARVA